MDKDSVSFKIYLFSNVSDEPEIRRFGLQTAVASSYRALRERITDVYTGLSDKPFTMAWKDDEDDEVSVSSDDELFIALTSMKTDVKKFYIRLQSPVSGSTENGGNVVHLGVYCDGCEGNIVGYRYKCLMCRDYDLCSVCEQAGIHPEHIMLRIPNRSFTERMNLRKTLHCMRSFMPEIRHHEGDTHPCKRRRKHEKHGTCPLAESLNPDSAAYGYLDWGYRALQTLLDPLGATVEIQFPAHPEDKQKKKKREEKQNKETPEPHPASQAKGAPASPPDLSPDPLTQKINEISKILAKQSVSKDAEDDGWVAFEELKKDVREPRPSTSSEGVANPKPNPSAPPTEKTGAKSSPEANLYPNLVPQKTPGNDPVKESLEKMLSMGFTNDGDWLKRLLEAKDGNIDKVLEVLSASMK